MNPIPPRVTEAEQRAHFKRLLEASSLGDPDAKEAIERQLQYNQTLPDRWIRLNDLPRLFADYWERRETWGDDHDTATAHVMIEADYEPDQHDMDTRGGDA